MLTIVFLDRDTLSAETVLRAPGFPHELIVHGRTTAEEVSERIAKADIVISNKVPLRRESLIHAPYRAALESPAAERTLFSNLGRGGLARAMAGGVARCPSTSRYTGSR